MSIIIAPNGGGEALPPKFAKNVVNVVNFCFPKNVPPGAFISNHKIKSCGFRSKKKVFSFAQIIRIINTSIENLHFLASLAKSSPQPCLLHGTLTEGKAISTNSLLVKADCFVKKVNNIFYMKLTGTN